MVSFILDWTLGSIRINVTPANFWRQRLNQAADRRPFTNKSVGIKGTLFPLKQYKPLKYVVLLQAGSINTWCHVVFKNTQSRRNEMASIRQSFYMESNGKAEMGSFPWKWSTRSRPDISVSPFFSSLSLYKWRKKLTKNWFDCCQCLPVWCKPHWTIVIIHKMLHSWNWDGICFMPYDGHKNGSSQDIKLFSYFEGW